ncbi:LamG-like jellyroll fold domain-containing protein [Planctomicrobium sp. SH664]|uniref:LamG-like jellyroll fold domain-containing protein n=1 Tax=Planctomicrobium sp. SH664 TaxID=3448125 RepID=UPI003F5AE446
MEFSSLNEAQERELFRRVADGRVGPEEFAALQSRLLADEGFRNRYVLHMGLEASLYEEMHIQSAISIPTRRRNRLRRLVLLIASVAACLLIGAAIGAGLQSSGRLAAAPDVAPSLLKESENEPAAPAPTQNSLAALPADRRGETLAIVTYSSQSENGAQGPSVFSPGQRLSSGTIHLSEGELQLEFVNGAQVLFAGPAVFDINSSKEIKLHSGRAATRVPKTAKGFVVKAPDAAVVDLGTEFTLTVNDEGRSDVGVTEGEVEVSLLGHDGSTIRSERVSERQFVQVATREGTLDSIAKIEVPQLKISRRPPPPLPISQAYVDAVKSSAPFAYWRFEELIDGKVPNEMGSRFPAVLHDHPTHPGITVEGGISTYSTIDVPRYFSIDEGLEKWNESSFTLELWTCPDRLHFGTMVNVLTHDWSRNHLNAIEIAIDTPLIHPPGALRFLHRHPPGRLPSQGINLFDRETCSPGQWSHIVTVKTPDYLSLSVNGQEIRRIDGPIGCDEDLYQLCIGEIDNLRTARQFEGSMDEIAIYKRALSPEEILHHYELVKGKLASR